MDITTIYWIVLGVMLLLVIGLLKEIRPAIIFMMAVVIFMADKVAEALKSNPRISRAIDWTIGTVFAVFAVRILLAEGTD